jgi:hypothetical protein
MSEAVAIIFDRFNVATSMFEAVRVPIGDVGPWFAEHLAIGPGYPLARKVEWADGGWSWAKAWYFGDCGALSRIGAGAYGETTVWKDEERIELVLLAQRLGLPTNARSNEALRRGIAAAEAGGAVGQGPRPVAGNLYVNTERAL